MVGMLYAETGFKPGPGTVRTVNAAALLRCTVSIGVWPDWKVFCFHPHHKAHYWWRSLGELSICTQEGATDPVGSVVAGEGRTKNKINNGRLLECYIKFVASAFCL